MVCAFCKKPFIPLDFRRRKYCRPTCKYRVFKAYLRTLYKTNQAYREKKRAQARKYKAWVPFSECAATSYPTGSITKFRGHAKVQVP